MLQMVTDEIKFDPATVGKRVMVTLSSGMGFTIEEASNGMLLLKSENNMVLYVQSSCAVAVDISNERLL